jgi:RNA polymerase sigma-70 factor (ECF subfamily)
MAASDEREDAATVLDAYSGELFRYLYALLGDSPYVQDIAQETMMRALAAFRRYDPSRPLGAWLMGIALNVTRHYWRRIRRARAASEALAAAPQPAGPDPERELLAAEQAALLHRALDGLPPRLREAFVLLDVERLAPEEAARIAGTTVGAVRTRAWRARAALRRLVDGLERKAEVER